MTASRASSVWTWRKHRPEWVNGGSEGGGAAGSRSRAETPDGAPGDEPEPGSGQYTWRQQRSVYMSGRPHRSPRPTDLLLAWGRGETSAFDQLVPLVHEELRRLARRYMARERRDHTLQASALVNEAYLRLIDLKQMQWQNRAHFFAMSARVMRRILVDFARARRNEKRGGGAPG